MDERFNEYFNKRVESLERDKEQCEEAINSISGRMTTDENGKLTETNEMKEYKSDLSKIENELNSVASERLEVESWNADKEEATSNKEAIEKAIQSLQKDKEQCEEAINSISGRMTTDENGKLTETNEMKEYKSELAKINNELESKEKQSEQYSNTIEEMAEKINQYAKEHNIELSEKNKDAELEQEEKTVEEKPAGEQTSEEKTTDEQTKEEKIEEQKEPEKNVTSKDEEVEKINFEINSRKMRLDRLVEDKAKYAIGIIGLEEEYDKQINALGQEIESLNNQKLEFINSGVEKPEPQDYKEPEEKPVEEKPIEEKPIEEKPIEEKPIEEKPIEGKPIEGKPIEDDRKPKQPENTFYYVPQGYQKPAATPAHTISERVNTPRDVGTVVAQEPKSPQSRDLPVKGPKILRIIRKLGRTSANDNIETTKKLDGLFETMQTYGDKDLQEKMKFIEENGDKKVVEAIANSHDIKDFKWIQEKIDNYCELIKDPSTKKDSDLRITYDLKTTLLDRLKMTRAEYKDLKEKAYAARDYADVEAGPITKIQFKIKDILARKDQKKIIAPSIAAQQAKIYGGNKQREGKEAINEEKQTPREKFLESLQPPVQKTQEANSKPQETEKGVKYPFTIKEIKDENKPIENSEKDHFTIEEIKDENKPIEKGVKYPFTIKEIKDENKPIEKGVKYPFTIKEIKDENKPIEKSRKYVNKATDDDREP